MFGDNILDAVKEHPLAYDIFFNLKSHIQDLPHDVEESNDAKFARINGEIVYGDNVFTIDRKDYVNKINEHICNKQNIVIIGESGSGKSGISGRKTAPSAKQTAPARGKRTRGPLDQRRRRPGTVRSRARTSTTAGRTVEKQSEE